VAARNLLPRWRRVGGGLFLVLFGATFLYFLVPEILANLAAANWTATSCRILSSGIMTQEPRDSEEGDILYRVAVHYSYEAAAQSYESSRYRFVDPFTNDRIAAETAVAAYASSWCHHRTSRPVCARRKSGPGDSLRLGRLGWSYLNAIRIEQCSWCIRSRSGMNGQHRSIRHCRSLAGGARRLMCWTRGDEARNERT
jgi:hypothetical protein